MVNVSLTRKPYRRSRRPAAGGGGTTVGGYASGRWGCTLTQWDQIRHAVPDALFAASGTITHHHRHAAGRGVGVVSGLAVRRALLARCHSAERTDEGRR